MTELSEIDEPLTLLTIEKTNKTYICLKCSAKIEFAVFVTARYSNCKDLNKFNCASNLYMKILLKNKKEEKLSLFLFHQTVL